MLTFIQNFILVNHTVVLISGVKSPIISYLLRAEAIQGFEIQIFKACRTFPHMTNQHTDYDEPPHGLGICNDYDDVGRLLYVTSAPS